MSTKPALSGDQRPRGPRELPIKALSSWGSKQELRARALDENFDAVEIYEAERIDVLRELATPGSVARNERGALGVSKFKAIGRLRWSRAGVNVA